MIKEFLLKAFNVSDPSYEYWVYTKDIKIPEPFKHTPVGREKFKRKNQYFDRNGKFESKIILDKNWLLVDGYSSYVIAKNRHIDKIPVYFK